MSGWESIARRMKKGGKGERGGRLKKTKRYKVKSRRGKVKSNPGWRREAAPTKARQDGQEDSEDTEERDDL